MARCSRLRLYLHRTTGGRPPVRYQRGSRGRGRGGGGTLSGTKVGAGGTHWKVQGSHGTGKMAKNIPCQGKHREFGYLAKTQGKHREFYLLKL